MNHQLLLKALLALVLVLSVILGSGVVSKRIGISLVPVAHACTSSTGGGC